MPGSYWVFSWFVFLFELSIVHWLVPMFSRGYSYLSSSLNGQIKKEYFVEADVFSTL